MSRVVLVTGSAKGIGASIIKEFASKGDNVVINYLTSEKEAYALQKEVEKLGVKSLVIKCDITDEVAVNKMIKEVEEKLGHVDVLVNNAATYNDSFFAKKNSNEFKRVLDINVVGAFNVAKAASKSMLNNKWGRIINISSTNGINTYYPICMEYDASKAALISLTHNLAIELAPYVNVNVVAPGFINTETETKNMDEEFIKSEEEKILLKRMGTPKEVAQLVYFLASDAASYINNAVIRVDGGQYGSN